MKQLLFMVGSTIEKLTFSFMIIILILTDSVVEYCLNIKGSSMKRWVSFVVSVFLVFSCGNMNVFAEDTQVENTDPVTETVENGETIVEDGETKETTEDSTDFEKDQDSESTDAEAGKDEEESQMTQTGEPNANPEDSNLEGSESEEVSDELFDDDETSDLDNVNTDGEKDSFTESDETNGLSDEKDGTESDRVEQDALNQDENELEKDEFPIQVQLSQNSISNAISNSQELFRASINNDLDINLSDYNNPDQDDVLSLGDGCTCSEQNPHKVSGSTAFIDNVFFWEQVDPVSIDINGGEHYIELADGVSMDERRTSNSAIDVNAGVLHLSFGNNVVMDGGDNNGAHPAIYVANGATLYLEGSGELTLNGHKSLIETNGASGISGDGEVIVKSGTINAAGEGNNGAGIDVKTLTIDGGTVDAKGVDGGAGIHTDEGYTLTINGGNVVATGSSEIASAGNNGSAGIGGNVGRLISGNSSSFGNITITGGNITATGGVGGAGIGSGYIYGSSEVLGNVTISGGTVIARGSASGLIAGPGIGTGANGDFIGSVNLNGGVIYAAGSSGDGLIGEKAPSIGAGGVQLGTADSHGTLNINGFNGFVAVIAPDGLGDTSQIENWNGIIANGGYYDPSSGNYVTQSLSEDAIKLTDDGFVFSSSVSNVVGNVTVSDGQTITVNNGATLIVRDSGNYLKDFNNNSSISLDNPSILRFEQNATLIGDGGTLNSAGVTEFHGGVDQVQGSGNLSEVYRGKIRILLTEDLVSQNWDKVVFDNTNYSPAITVKVDNLWGTYSYEYSPYDDYFFNAPASYRDAGTYVTSIEVKPSDDSRLLEHGTALNVSFVIEKHDFTVNMPATWTLEIGVSNLMDKLPPFNGNQHLDDYDVGPEVKNNYNFDVLKSGTIQWYQDEDCTILLTNDFLNDYAPEENVDVYWSYSHNDSNFVSPKTGKVTLTFDDRPVLTVTINRDGKDVTRKTISGVYGDTIDLDVTLTRDGQPVTDLPKDGQWDSDHTDLITVSNGKLKLIDVPSDVNQLVAITYKVPAHSDPDDNHAASQAVVYVKIDPKPITLTGVELVDRDYEAGNTMVEVDESTLTIPDTQLVSGDEDKVQVEVNGNVDLKSDEAREYTNVVIDTLSLTGNKAHCYKLEEVIDPLVTIKSVHNETSNDDKDETQSNPGTWDDGGPFTTDSCGSVYDRWGNLIYQGTCGVTTGFQLVNTSDK